MPESGEMVAYHPVAVPARDLEGQVVGVRTVRSASDPEVGVAGA